MLLQQPGYHRCQVGAQRLVVIGNGSFVDQLEGLDDERLLVKWKLVSHSLNVNPFPASFVNWRCRLQLVEVTREGSTVMTWIGSLDTDPHAVQLMREEMMQRINVCFEGLIATVASTPCRAKSETHLHAMIGNSLSHLSARPCVESGFTLSDHGRRSSVASSLSDPQTPPQATPSISRRSSTMLPPHQVPLGRQQSLPPLPKDGATHSHVQNPAAVRSECCENTEQDCHRCKHRLPEENSHEPASSFKEPQKSATNQGGTQHEGSLWDSYPFGRGRSNSEATQSSGRLSREDEASLSNGFVGQLPENMFK